MLRILTANLYNGRARPASLARVLDAVRPDVVAAQELAPDAAEILTQRFEHGLVHAATDFTGLALVSRHPIEVLRHRLPLRDAMRGRLSAPDGVPLTLWSVHLANPVDMPLKPFRRRGQLRALESALAGVGPVVAVGDFNATPRWPAYRRIVRHLDDGVAAWAEEAELRPSRTWAPYTSWPPLLRIDHAFVRGVRVVDAATRRVGGSDHRALVVDVEVPPAREALDGFE